jgi:hypothetical protein
MPSSVPTAKAANVVAARKAPVGRRRGKVPPASALAADSTTMDEFIRRSREDSDQKIAVARDALATRGSEARAALEALEALADPASSAARRVLAARVKILEDSVAEAVKARARLERDARPFARAVFGRALAGSAGYSALLGFVGTRGRMSVAQGVLKRAKSRCTGRPFLPTPIDPDACACGETMLHQPAVSMLSCPRCNACRPYLSTTSGRQSYANMPTTRRYTYNPSGHLRDVLDLLQGREPLVPDEVVEAVAAHLHKMKIRPGAKVTYEHVDEALRFLHIPYYKNYVQIYHRIFPEIPKPTFLVEEETRIFAMQDAIQIPYEKHKGDRVNSLSYNYFVACVCQLLGITRFLPVIVVLKGDSNKSDQDVIWKAVCRELNWEYSELQSGSEHHVDGGGIRAFMGGRR